MSQKPAIPRGTRDFSPVELDKRRYIIGHIKQVFKNFCFYPIETPAFENTSTLMGNYGDEGDRLIFKILNSGNFLSKVDQLSTIDSKTITPQISEKSLRYDLTVPFSRYVAMHQNELIFPFKRYQIQPVWRADRPQKGRYREFYQCDADIVGTTSLWQEVEFLQLYQEVFKRLNLPVIIRINNRKILSGIVEVLGIKTSITDFIVILDKIKKIGEENVIEELKQKGVSDVALQKIRPLLTLDGSLEQKLGYITSFLEPSITGLKGLEELQFVLSKSEAIGFPKNMLNLDITLARGLHYYTGCIFEVFASNLELGAIGGGGRYDNLTASFGLKNTSGVGISFGLDRIYLVLEALKLFPSTIETNHQILFLNFGDEESLQCQKLIKKLRAYNIPSELYPDATVKPGKQMAYAHKKQYPFVILIGSREIKNRQAIIKNMNNGTQNPYDFEKLPNYLQTQLSST